MLISNTLSDYVTALASGEPSPGGGAAAALTAAQAAALVSMVCRFTIGRKKYAAFEESTAKALARADEIGAVCLQAVDEDADAYAAVAAALKVPKADLAPVSIDSENRERRLHAALVAAANVPAGVAASCIEVMTLVGRLAGRSNQSVASDLSVALELAGCAMECALINVEVNLKYLRDPDVVETYRRRVDSFRQDGESVRGKTARALTEATA